MSGGETHPDEHRGPPGNDRSWFDREAVLLVGWRAGSVHRFSPKPQPPLWAVDEPLGAVADHLVSEAHDAPGAPDLHMGRASVVAVAPGDNDDAGEGVGVGCFPGTVEELQ